MPGNFEHLGTHVRLTLALTSQGCSNIYAPIPDCTSHLLSYSYTISSITLTFYFPLRLFRSFGHGYEDLESFDFWGLPRTFFFTVWGGYECTFAVWVLCQIQLYKEVWMEYTISSIFFCKMPDSFLRTYNEQLISISSRIRASLISTSWFKNALSSSLSLS